MIPFGGWQRLETILPFGWGRMGDQTRNRNQRGQGKFCKCFHVAIDR
jgi:hypothetical protein